MQYKAVPFCAIVTLVSFLVTAQGFADNHKVSGGEKILKGLLITGGGYHDYESQKKILSIGLSERANIDWEIVHEGEEPRQKTHQFDLFKKEDWGKGYDFVLYNLCFAGEKDTAYIEGITKVHEAGLPAVALHCTMHSHHWDADTEEWKKFLGVTSPNHGKKHPVTVTKTRPEHPAIKGLPDNWVTELYNVTKVWPTATVLAEGTIDGGKTKQACIWVNQYGKGRVFATTIGHHNETVSSDGYLGLLSQGILWATGKVGEDGVPEPGYTKEKKPD